MQHVTLVAVKYSPAVVKAVILCAAVPIPNPVNKYAASLKEHARLIAKQRIAKAIVLMENVQRCLVVPV